MSTPTTTGSDDVDPLEAHIRRLVDAAPPLTHEQRDRLTTVVRSHQPDRPASGAA